MNREGGGSWGNHRLPHVENIVKAVKAAATA